MSLVAFILIGVGLIMVGLGSYFLYLHYQHITPNEELIWLGYGKHPFKKT